MRRPDLALFLIVVTAPRLFAQHSAEPRSTAASTPDSAIVKDRAAFLLFVRDQRRTLVDEIVQRDVPNYNALMRTNQDFRIVATP